MHLPLFLAQMFGRLFREVKSYVTSRHSLQGVAVLVLSAMMLPGLFGCRSIPSPVSPEVRAVGFIWVRLGMTIDELEHAWPQAGARRVDVEVTQIDGSKMRQTGNDIDPDTRMITISYPDGLEKMCLEREGKSYCTGYDRLEIALTSGVVTGIDVVKAAGAMVDRKYIESWLRGLDIEMTPKLGMPVVNDIRIRQPQNLFEWRKVMGSDTVTAVAFTRISVTRYSIVMNRDSIPIEDHYTTLYLSVRLCSRL